MARHNIVIVHYRRITLKSAVTGASFPNIRIYFYLYTFFRTQKELLSEFSIYRI